MAPASARGKPTEDVNLDRRSDKTVSKVSPQDLANVCKEFSL